MLNHALATDDANPLAASVGMSYPTSAPQMKSRLTPLPWNLAFRALLRLVPLLTFACAALLPRLAAQAPATGAIAGTVANSKTRQFLENAEIRLEGSNRSALTDRDGSYRIGELAAGSYTMTVTYQGLDVEKRTVTVSPGATTREEFNLTAETYRLDKFVVSAEAEGNAAELNRQKRSSVLMNSVSADALGVVPEGNIGEFLKYMPGLQVNYSNADANTVSVRGQDPESTVFTFDGQVPAAAGLPPRSASGSSDASSRAFEFSQASIDRIESIEFFKAPPPWMQPATGGVVNAVTKNAFAQKGRRLTTIVSMNGNSEMMKLGKVDGPGQRATHRITPSGRLNYSEAFLNNTLGVAFTAGGSTIVSPNHTNNMLYMPFVAGTTAAPASDANPEYINSFTNVEGPNIKTRRNVGLNMDYKLGAFTVLKLNLGYNSYLEQTRQHTFRARSVVNTSIITAGSNQTDTTISNGQIDVFANYSDYKSTNHTFGGAVEHKWDAWRVSYAASYGKSDSKVTDLPDMINSVQVGLDPTLKVGWHVKGSPDSPAPTLFEQTSGPNLFDLSSYNTVLTNKPSTTVGAGGVILAPSTAPQAGGTGITLQTAPRFQNDTTINANFDVRRSFANLRFPVELRAGVNFYRMERHKRAGQIILWFAGPDGVPFTGDEKLNMGQFTMTNYRDKFLYGDRPPPLLDPYKVAQYMQQFPLAFQNLEPGNVQREAINTQSLIQDISAGYIAATVQFGPRLTVVGGVRTELTENFARGAVRQNSLGTGLIVNSLEWNRAIFSKTQRVTNDYQDYFPNLQAVYRFTPNLLVRGAVSKSMSRPGIQTILPNTTVNDTATIPTVTVNNTALNPTYSNNYDFQLEYYTKPSGSITVGWFRKEIDNYVINETSTIEAGPDNGFDGQYAGYRLSTQDNGGAGLFEGVEVAVRQQLKPYLGKLPELFQGWEVFANYTRNYKGQAPNRSGVVTKPLAPNFYDWNANYGISYTTPRRTFYIQARTVIYPAAMTTAPTATDLRPTYLTTQQRWDFTMRYRFSNRYAVELTGANIFSEPSYEQIKSGRIIQRREFGANYALSFVANIW